MRILALTALGLTFFCGAFASPFSRIDNKHIHVSTLKQQKADALFLESINTKVMETLMSSESIPGLNAEEFATLRPEIIDHWEELFKNGSIQISATDKEVRPYFVALQAVIEHLLAQELNSSIKSLTGVILTPMPATPLCTKGEISKELVDPSIKYDPLRLFTVKARTTIVRDYLHKGGKLYIAYPKEGFSKRTAEQRQIYQKELANYPANLFDVPLNCSSIDPSLIGAFYLFKSPTDKLFGFSIKMTQANDPQDVGHFGLWFGELHESALRHRVSHMLNPIVKHAGSSLHLPLEFQLLNSIEA